MKLSFLSIGLLAILSPLTAAWDKEDREIFRIRDEISMHEADPTATFYDILGVSKSASLDEVNKAFRKLTKELHPDKVTQKIRAKANKAKKKPTTAQVNAAIQAASDRQARLSLIANIMRGPARDRYDHYLTNGFPLWKGTDYYYNRYRPGFGTVLIGLFVMVGGGAHYIILYTSWKRQKEFVDRYIRFARETAWGNGANIPGAGLVEPEPAPEEADEEEAGPPQPMNRRQRRMQEKESKQPKREGRSGKRGNKVQSEPGSRDISRGPTGARKRVVAENGKILVVDSLGDVYLEGKDEDGNTNEYLLDPSEISKPTFKDTAVVRVPAWVFRLTIGRFLPGATAKPEVEDVVEDDDSDVPQPTPPSTDSAGEDYEMLDKSIDSLGKAKSTGSQPSNKAKKRKGRK